MPESGKPKDRVQAFLLQKYLHFYDQVNDGEIDSAIEIFDDPFKRSPSSPSGTNASSANLIETKQKSVGEMKIKLSNSALDGYIAKLQKAKYPQTDLNLMKV